MKNQMINYAALLAFALSQPTFARDITHEQQAAYDARFQAEQANSDLANANTQLEAQQKQLEREQARLKELQDKQTAAKKALENANADLDAKTKVLDKAWEERDR